MSFRVHSARFEPLKACDVSQSGASVVSSLLVFVASALTVAKPTQVQAVAQPDWSTVVTSEVDRSGNDPVAVYPSGSTLPQATGVSQGTSGIDAYLGQVDVIEPPGIDPGNPLQEEPFLTPDRRTIGPLPLLRETPDFETYRLGPGDAIFVNVRQYPDLSFQATLDLQGNVIVPLAGVTPLSGQTLKQTEAGIAAIYNQFVVDPDVSITLIAQRGVEVTVLGEVVRPGYYPLGAPQILTALLSAGGTTGQADLRNILIQRPLVDGTVLEDTVDLFTPLREGRSLPNAALQDGDVVIVDRLDPTELDEYDSTLVSRSTLAQPTIAVRLLNFGAGRGGGASGNLTQVELPNGSRFVDFLVRANLNPDTNKLKKITLIRFNEEAGQAVTTTLNGRDAFRGDPAENPPLMNNDVIIVNRTLAARVTFFFNTFTQPFRDVLGFLLFFEQLADSAGDLFSP